MLRIYSSTHIQPLADRLASELSKPLEDPMAPEWIAVPSAGMERWLRLQLSVTLGAGPRGGDGIAANIEFAFPDTLRGRLLADGDTPDAWRLKHLVWSVLHVLTSSTDPALAIVRNLPPGAHWYSRARRIADLFDRYSYHRPRMLLGWLAGDDNDGNGDVVPAPMAWQPALWRLVRAHIGQMSPPERLGERLEAIARDPSLVDLGPRLAIFGVSTLPGGPQFLELLNAVGASRTVDLYLLDPSVAAADAIAALAAESPLVGAARAEDHSDRAINNPLLRSWARPTREAQVQLADAVHHGLAPIQRLHGPTHEPATLLARLQADVVGNKAPAGDFIPTDSDASLQIHACHGATRQVEVLRDVIAGLFADDETLSEEDVLVVVPDIVKFAPLIAGVFGRSADLNSQSKPDPDQPPNLRYRITDRSLRSSYPLLNTTASIFDLIAGRFGASDVLDFCALSPVRARFAFSDDHLADIARWVDDANIRWGLDGHHRSRWGLPDNFQANSWRSGLDQLLMGVAVHDDQPSFGPGKVPPLGVEGTNVETLGRFAELIHILANLADEAAQSRTAGDWCSLTAATVEQLCEVPWSEQWQRQRLAKVLDTIGQAASVEPADPSLTLGDFRRLLAEHFVPPAARSGFFEGGITVTSLQPMRWIPHRVVCVLGADQEAFGSTGINGDDLVAAAPRIGDPDPRGERRQAMLETLMSASDHFVITRTGRDLRANAEVPPAVPVAELLEAARATLHPNHRAKTLERSHSRQGNDASNFESVPSGRPFGFDPRAKAGAEARLNRSQTLKPFLVERLDERPFDSVDLAHLQRFFRRPVRYFFHERLDTFFAQVNEATPDHLPVDLNPLEAWQLGMDLIDAGFNASNTRRFIAIQQARGALPPGHLGDAQVRDLKFLVDAMFLELKSRQLIPRDDRYTVDAVVDRVRLDGQVVSWSEGTRGGPVNLTYSQYDGRHRLSLWLDLLAMTVTDPETHWQALGMARKKPKKGELPQPRVTVMEVRGHSPQDRRINASAGLAVAIDLLKRGSREPLPLFAKSSPLIAGNKSVGREWDEGMFPERGDDYHAEVFGHLDAIGLLEIPLRPDDPPGLGNNRAERFARVLWDSVEATVVEVSE